jgi:hypothetical protein
MNRTRVFFSSWLYQHYRNSSRTGVLAWNRIHSSGIRLSACNSYGGIAWRWWKRWRFPGNGFALPIPQMHSCCTPIWQAHIRYKGFDKFRLASLTLRIAQFEHPLYLNGSMLLSNSIKLKFVVRYDPRGAPGPRGTQFENHCCTA